MDENALDQVGVSGATADQGDGKASTEVRPRRLWLDTMTFLGSKPFPSSLPDIKRYLLQIANPHLAEITRECKCGCKPVIVEDDAIKGVCNCDENTSVDFLEAQDAGEALFKVRILEEHLRDGISPPTLQHVFELRGIIDRLLDRHLEPMVKAALAKSESGGYSKRILKTPEQKQIALDIILKYHALGLSQTNACVRAGAELAGVFEKPPSVRTLQRLLKEHLDKHAG